MTSMEVLLPAGEDSKRADVVFHGLGRGGADLWTDITVTHPQATTYVGQAAAEGLYAANLRERQKRQKYHGRVPDEDEFAGAAVEVFGGLGKGMQNVIGRIGAKASRTNYVFVPYSWATPTFKLHVRHAVAVALWRGTARSVAQLLRPQQREGIGLL